MERDVEEYYSNSNSGVVTWKKLFATLLYLDELLFCDCITFIGLLYKQDT